MSRFFLSLLTDWIAFSPEQIENENHILGDAVAVDTRVLASAVQISGQELGCHSPSENNR